MCVPESHKGDHVQVRMPINETILHACQSQEALWYTGSASSFMKTSIRKCVWVTEYLSMTKKGSLKHTSVNLLMCNSSGNCSMLQIIKNYVMHL